MRRIVFLAVVLALVLSVRTSAQMPTAQKWENVEWYSVMSWQFTGENADSAETIFWDHMYPLLAETWPGSTCLRIMTGEGGGTCFGPMEEGLETMAWRMSPADVSFVSTFMEREGEAAMDLFRTMGGAMTGWTFNLALKHKGGM